MYRLIMIDIAVDVQVKIEELVFNLTFFVNNACRQNVFPKCSTTKDQIKRDVSSKEVL